MSRFYVITKKQELEQEIINEIKKNDVLRISDFIEKLNTSADKIIPILIKLKKEGKIEESKIEEVIVKQKEQKLK